ncbi:hypothetical protein [Marinobacterium stanieri]|uniref:hypothetical protein n=1 Tax=Marinobacterium stanieri TaxID=49186 RepID=UPI000255A5F3|nr:hypothetical protein [Marinobacterium stanieri]
MRRPDKIGYTLLAIAICIGLPAFGYGMWQLERQFNYRAGYESEVRKTVCGMVKPEYLSEGCEVSNQSNKSKPLSTEIVDGQLIISIGTDTLLNGLEIGRPHGLGDITITDRELFLKEFVLELNAESEDGSTLIHRVLDKAVSNALENGAQGVEYDD